MENLSFDITKDYIRYQPASLDGTEYMIPVCSKYKGMASGYQFTLFGSFVSTKNSGALELCLPANGVALTRGSVHFAYGRDALNLDDVVRISSNQPEEELDEQEYLEQWTFRIYFYKKGVSHPVCWTPYYSSDEPIEIEYEQMLRLFRAGGGEYFVLFYNLPLQKHPSVFCLNGNDCFPMRLFETPTRYDLGMALGTDNGDYCKEGRLYVYKKECNYSNYRQLELKFQSRLPYDRQDLKLVCFTESMQLVAISPKTTYGYSPIVISRESENQLITLPFNMYTKNLWGQNLHVIVLLNNTPFKSFKFKVHQIRCPKGDRPLIATSPASFPLAERGNSTDPDPEPFYWAACMAIRNPRYADFLSCQADMAVYHFGSEWGRE